ncbi:hypothetical protein D3C87_1324560 [compost metagenome]
MTEFVGKFVEFNAAQQHFQCIGTHSRDEFVGIRVRKQLVLAWKFVDDVEVFIFGQEVEVAYAVLFLDTWLNNRVPFVINDLVEFLGRKSQQVTDFVRQAAEVPDMCNRNHQFNVTHALAANLFLSYLYTATVADNSFVANALVFPAVTFPVFYRTENALAEQTAHLRLVGPVVDGLRLGYFTEGAF